MKSETLLARLQQLVGAILAQQPVPSAVVLLGATVVGLALVLQPRAWLVTRHAVTIFHEGGHSLVSRLLGERGQRIHLNRDTSGYTQYMSAAGPFQRFRSALSAMAGYPAGCVLGLAMALLLAFGHAAATLWLLLACLLAILVQVRNLWGWFSVLASLAVLVLSTWFLPDQYQTVLASLVMTFFLYGGLRTAWEQRLTVRSLRGSRDDQSDARKISQLLHLPVGVVLWGFIVFNSACVLGAYVALFMHSSWA